jgi:hypothetical protein
MKLLAMPLELFRAAAEAPEERDESDLDQTDNRQQEEDCRVHSFGDRAGAAKADGAGIRARDNQDHRENG